MNKKAKGFFGEFKEFIRFLENPKKLLKFALDCV